VLPTLCDILGIEYRNVDGYSLFSGIEKFSYDRILLSEASLFNAGRGTQLLKPDKKVMLVVKRGCNKFIFYDKYFTVLYNTCADPYERKAKVLQLNKVDTIKNEELKEMLYYGIRRLYYVKKIILKDYLRYTIKRRMIRHNTE
jgi:hypothetical protein